MIDYRFRAYDIINKKMYVDDEHENYMATSKGLLKREVGHYKNVWQLMNRDEVILTPYVGLYDKNGKPLYIGDLVTSSITDIHGEMSVGIITYIEGKVSVECLSNVACDAFHNASQDEIIKFIKHGTYVVGNVFEDWDMIPKHAIPYVKSLGYQETYFVERYDV